MSRGGADTWVSKDFMLFLMYKTVTMLDLFKNLVSRFMAKSHKIRENLIMLIPSYCVGFHYKIKCRLGTSMITNTLFSQFSVNKTV